jgi:predicted nucleotidyltransferase
MVGRRLKAISDSAVFMVVRRLDPLLGGILKAIRMATATPPSLDDLARMLPGFCHRHSIARVEVFGSVARGETREGSDLDLMVTFRPGVRPGLEFFAMQEELEQILGCPVDLLTRRSVEHSDNPIRRRSILESAREVYAG